jgi:hypothetical protein
VELHLHDPLVVQYAKDHVVSTFNRQYIECSGVGSSGIGPSAPRQQDKQMSDWYPSDSDSDDDISIDDID